MPRAFFAAVLAILAMFPACQSGAYTAHDVATPAWTRSAAFVSGPGVSLPLRFMLEPRKSASCCSNRVDTGFRFNTGFFGLSTPRSRPAAQIAPMLRPAHRQPATKMLLFDSFGDEGSDEWEGAEHEDVLEHYRVVLLRDEKLDRVIECFVEREMEVDGKKYATLLPVDTPVILAGYAEVNGTNQLVPVLEDSAIDELFPTASAVLAEMDLSLSRSAVVLTVEGRDDSLGDSEEDDEEGNVIYLGGGLDSDPDKVDEDDDEMDIEGILGNPAAHTGSANKERSVPVGLKSEELVDRSKGDGEGEGRMRDPLSDDDDEEDMSNEKVQVLATFLCDGRKYVVAAPLEPVLIIGAPMTKKADVTVESRLSELNAILGTSIEEGESAEEAEYLLPEKEELERVTPRIEAELETLWDEEEKERTGLRQLRQRLIDQWARDQ
eukprot:CAMPEP_0181300118 /NCGR_PEP_ID=MMETSP1101-20121128/6716_1 /TAXON_ID=46948 /ORGANISM="Rhodomonas abbreviata, Strain Caron Lab Isolate" /LENGTH=435 /DNA_ID=CAMNT_0023405327 /DNA_START=292 /DNA_END=1599 /DNA_ORIENTATION=+